MVERDESPIGFWLLVALGFGIGTYLIYKGVLSLALLKSQMVAGFSNTRIGRQAA
jgi:hypothetical protein